MGKSRSFTLFMLAMIIAAGAAWVANNWLQVRMMPTTEGPSRSVLTATRTISAGEQIQEGDLQLIRMPDHLVPSAALRDPEVIIGQFARQNLYPGEVLFRDRFRPDIEVPSLATSVTELVGQSSNVRQITLRVDKVVGMGLFLEPGVRVDVLATHQGRNIRTPSAIQTVVQNVKVLAIDQLPAPPDASPLMVVHHVTLEVSPYQAQLLSSIRDGWQTILSLKPPQS